MNTKRPLRAPLRVEPQGHIGIASGPVLAGEVGGRVHREFTLSGHTVQLAARLEDVSDRGQIYVGDLTFERTRTLFNYRPVEPVALHGSVDTVPAYELLAIADARRRRKRDSERRQATVMFAEIVGLAVLRDTHSAEEQTDILNHCFAALEAAVVEFGGCIDKFIGAGLMALFGVPTAIENAPRQALNAAAAMGTRMRRSQLDLALPVELRLHMGINSGLVIAGEIGGRVRRGFTVMGDTTNAASRLKDAAPVGAIFVGPETYRLTRDHFDFGEIQPLRLKVKAEPLAARALMSTSPHATRPAARSASNALPRRWGIKTATG